MGKNSCPILYLIQPNPKWEMTVVFRKTNSSLKAFLLW